MFLFKLILLFYLPFIHCKVDYYELLGVKKAATTQEIRRAFKQLAVSLHPDKNQEDPEAHDKFIKITRAYEVLKDAEKRKHYDIHGEDDSQQTKPQYHSYTYYRDHFGIYDDDPHIVTLSNVDFENNVESSGAQWFVNFYSPMCGSCHKLAPVWRALAEEMHGAVYFGAVNCEEDWSLCREQGISSYPTLVFYPTNEVLYGTKSREDLERFVLDRLKTNMIHVSDRVTWDLEKETHSSWLLILSPLSSVTKKQKIIAAMLRGLLGVAHISCKKMPCAEWNTDDGLMYLTKSAHDIWASAPIRAEEPRAVLGEVLNLLPGLQKIDDEKFQDLIAQLQLGSETPWLIYFHMGPVTDLDTEVKKLPALLSNFKIGRINCGRYSNLCQTLSISRYPLFGVFKPGGGWEFHHGSETALGVSAFAKEAAAATNIRTIGEAEFLSEVRRGGLFFVDFYAPWCPPCLRLLPQLRKASLSFTPGEISFATVDCTVHRDLCAGQGVRSYPTTLLFNATRRPQSFRGHSAASIIEFVEDILHPHVIELSLDTFYETVGRKTKGTIWMIGYFMPWCGPCQQLAPHYRKLAKIVGDIPFVKIAEVNCENEPYLCQERGVRSYPHIELHPYENEGVSSVIVFNGFQRDVQTLRRWLYNFIPSPVIELTPEEFSKILSGTNSNDWLVDFYAPWCGHCVSFEPDYISVSRKLEGKIKSGKLNCEMYPQLCQKAQISGYPTVKFFGGEHKRGVEIHSQNPTTILESVETLLKKTSRFTDEL
ncbi:dnaJ homolog subfamily C member 10 [Halyomorpha halys]|uniref:dnaJ homolog subfamily C member 10 n=1 Tax=Halyomorpha halys TaxID=286706 RepID=UPI0006D51C83|nr:dnaJ homolog subfamily C member 10-like [Halyomorpha halys]